VGLEGYDLSRPYATERQANEPAVKLMIEYAADKLPLWTRASYGGEIIIPGSYSPAMFDVFGPSHASRPNYGGYGIKFDTGRCSLQGKSDMSRCDGKRAELYGLVLVPDVFISWEAPDPLTYILRLRKGVLWPAIAPMARTDREVSAEDIAWYFETQKERGVVGRDIWRQTDSWKPLDRYTLKVTLKAPMADFLRAFTDRSQNIVPKECGEAEACARKTIMISPGPFSSGRLFLARGSSWSRTPSTTSQACRTWTASRGYKAPIPR
jgi:ABC-type transport system substrate-binding protein